MRPSPAFPIARLLPIALGLILAIPSASFATGGEGSVELGLDAGFRVEMFDGTYRGYRTSIDNAVLLNLPVSRVRVGVYTTDALEIEPSFGLALVSQSGTTAHSLDGSLRLIYNFGGSKRGDAGYVAAGGGILSIGTGSGSATQGHIGGAVGLKAPIDDRLAFRGEVGANRNMANDSFVGSWDFGLALGLSFFTR